MGVLSWLSVSFLLFSYSQGNTNQAPISSRQTTGNLTAPGASIYYETYGSGPLILFISGANGDADIWRPIAQTLSTISNHTIAIYDRRGFSRSYLSNTTTQNYTRLQADVNDTQLLLNTLSPNNPATVLGTSSGAIVALQLLLTYPQSLATLIAHEPPLPTLLPDNATLQDTLESMHFMTRAARMPLAVSQSLYFEAFTSTKLQYDDDPCDTVLASNLQYWFEGEFLEYPLHKFDVAQFENVKDKLVLANGNTTKTGSSPYRANLVLGEQLRLEVRSLAGNHVGYSGVTMADFAKDLLGILAGR